MPTIHDNPLSIHMQVDQELIPKKNGVETCHSLRIVHFNGSEAVRVSNAVPKSKPRKWLARKVRVWDALVPHWASRPAHPHAVIVCVMFEIQLLASTAQVYCSHFCQHQESLQLQNHFIQLPKSTSTAFMIIMRVAVTWSNSQVENSDVCWIVVLVLRCCLWQKLFTRLAWGWWLSW